MINLLELPIRRYVVVGSRALGTRPASDIDVICYKEDVLVPLASEDRYISHFMYEGKRVECLFADYQESLEIILNSHAVAKRIADPIELYVLKAGHIYVPGKKWDKHIADHAVLQKMIKLVYPISHMHKHPRFNDKTLDQMISLHRKCTKERMNLRGTPKLKNTNKEKFFDDKVVKFIDHDRIHDWMAHKEFPMYTYMQKEGNDVECEKELWEKFSLEDKIKCVLEEAYVIACERVLIPKYMRSIKLNSPSYNDTDVKTAVHWAIMRICTTLCSGWFRKFAVDHHFDIINSIDYDYHLKVKVDHLDPNYDIRNSSRSK